mmetsp:Transcript_11726/g.22209  ORF Transcript_11726/g.22209 Transcript_11726/m.22209 type:complete len:98 (+) Transcript_11726:1868-2161(+)
MGGQTFNRKFPPLPSVSPRGSRRSNATSRAISTVRSAMKTSREPILGGVPKIISNDGNALEIETAVRATLSPLSDSPTVRRRAFILRPSDISLPVPS